MTDRKVINIEFNRDKVDAQAVEKLSDSIASAINEAYADGVYPCVVVAILQGHLHSETSSLLNGQN